VRTLRQKIQSLIRSSLGYDVRQFGIGCDAYYDIGSILGKTNQPIVLDVGANRGQTIDEVLAILPNARIHSFEPGRAFKELCQSYGRKPNVVLHNMALGSAPGVLTLNEHSATDLSSFLSIGEEFQWEPPSSQRDVEVTTIDAYCEERIPAIDLLKTDTQGFDLEVLRGASRMFSQKRVRLVYMEINFAALYKELPAFDQIYRFMWDNGFRLVSLYKMHYINNLAGWTDGLFVNNSYRFTSLSCRDSS
jgi:FkbM family methyltransferase